MENGLVTWIVDHFIALMIPFGAVATPLVTLWYKRYLDKKDKLPHNVANAVDKYKRLSDYAQNLLKKLGAQRVNIWLFHNGGYCYTGEPIQKLSVICESNDEGVEPVMHIFQNQPIGIFQRNLEKLSKNDYFYEYNELQHKDSLAAINLLYKIVSSGLFKLKNKEGYFAGVLAIGYDHHHAITSGEVEIIKEVAKVIEMELARHRNA